MKKYDLKYVDPKNKDLIYGSFVCEAKSVTDAETKLLATVPTAQIVNVKIKP